MATLWCHHVWDRFCSLAPFRSTFHPSLRCSAPVGSITQAFLPSGFSWLWPMGSPGRNGREGEEWGQSVYFPDSLCARPPWVGCASWLKVTVPLKTAVPHNCLPCQVLVISPSYWQRLLCPSFQDPALSFTFCLHLCNKPSSHFPNLSAPSASCWDSNLHKVSLSPVFSINWQLSLKLDQIWTKHFSVRILHGWCSIRYIISHQKAHNIHPLQRSPSAFCQMVFSCRWSLSLAIIRS